ncbi:MAG TPA: ABC transporter substrate-binding protein [Blastocatellia bacterium]|nr:ABC transporter substrate-binding protein [Blastocatellia bacterium]
MRRIGVAVVLALGLHAPIGVEAQPTRTVPLIAILEPGSAANPGTGVATFREALRELGWVEGQNVKFEIRFGDFQIDRMLEVAKELAGLQPSVIHTHSPPGARAAKQATTTIPIVIGVAHDLVGDGIVASLARPGGNITGMTNLNPELDVKRLELLRAVTPRVGRVGLLVVAGTREENLRGLYKAAAALGVSISRAAVRDPSDFEGGVTSLIRDGARALFVQDQPPLSRAPELPRLALKHRLPSISQAPRFAEWDGLLQYGADIPDLFRRSATQVDKILKGAKPADLPVEQPTKITLIVNRKTAKAIGLTIPQSVLLRADQVIE